MFQNDNKKGDEEKPPPPTPETSILDNNSCVSEWLLSYIEPIVKLGGTKILEIEDIGPVSEQITAENCFNKVYTVWQEQKKKVSIENQEAKEKAEASGYPKKYKKKTASLTSAILKTYGLTEFWLSLFYYLLSAMLQFVPVLILNDLVSWLEEVETGKESSLFLGMNPWIQVIILGLCSILVTLLQVRTFVITTKLGIYSKTSCAAMLYQKSLTISATGRSRTSTGQVVNMMSNDTEQIQQFLEYFGVFLVAPLQIIVSLALIYAQVGHSTWVGVAYMIFLTPVNMKMFSTLGQMRREVLKHSDSRVKTMNEILSGIRVIKFYAWERAFRKEVGDIRKKELKALTKLTYVSSIGFSVVLLSAPVIQPILVFLTYVNVQDDEITAAKVFTTIALFNIMRFPFAHFPMGVLQYIQTKISIRRMSAYLDLPTISDYVAPEAHPDADEGSPESKIGSIVMKNASFGWINPEEERGPLMQEKKKSQKEEEKGIESTEHRKFITLENISCEIKPGELVAVVGEVGSGKSSFLSAILGEMEPIDGSKVYIPNAGKNSSHTALCTQTPWVVNDTVKGNITFGRTFDDQRYRAVLRACALKSDLDILPAGDMTEIGERGINLSGGQKARVCLARAMYNEGTQILLLDDPLSAVDSHVGEHLFSEAVAGDISRGKTRILVTHHVHFLPRCDSIIILEDGKIQHQGTYDELIAKGVEFKGLEDFAPDEESIDETDESPNGDVKSSRKLGRRSSSTGEDKSMMKKKGENFISDDDRETDSVDNSAYFRFGRVGESLRKLGRRSSSTLVKSKSMMKKKGENFISDEDRKTGSVDNSAYFDYVGESFRKLGRRSSSILVKDFAYFDSVGESSRTLGRRSSSILVKDFAHLDSVGESSRKLGRRSSSILVKEKSMMKKKGENLISDEERETGSVDNSIYFHYGRVGGVLTFVNVFIAQALNRGFEVGSSFWLAYWATETTLAIIEGNPFSSKTTMQYVGIYAAFGLASIFMIGVRGYLLAQHRLSASQKLHDSLSDSILRAPVSFFDTTPTGRILNRFAHDINKVDMELSGSLSQLLSAVFTIIGSLGAIVAATKGIMIIPLIPLAYVYYLIQKWFRKSSTELQRLTNITGSPIFADFSQTLSGTPTIRAYNMQEKFFNHCKSSFDTNNSAHSLVQLSSLWLGLRLDLLGSIITITIAIISVGTARFNFIPAAWLGLGLSSSIEVTDYLEYAVRMFADVESNLTSVERILSYTNEIEHEPPEEIPDKDPKEVTWPSKGEISVNNISMRYRDGPLVLKNLSLSIKGGEKIGIVGRTGSGKSSLMIALFRITGLEPDGGHVNIDGVNTSEIGITSLRSKLAIIPQDPVLFSNTVRYNLDPFGTVKDEEIWRVLKKVNLDGFIAGLENGLLEEVTEGGENFSQGQRQLLCIARSVLKNAKILIMDEATASIDNTTDELVQKMIRENFSNSTVLTIAHRLNTIMDSDRILVLDNGRLAELDTPNNLLSDKSSIFYGMVEESRNSKGSS